MEILTNNDLFRLFYCNIVSSDQCDEIGKYFGFLPAENEEIIKITEHQQSSPKKHAYFSNGIIM